MIEEKFRKMPLLITRADLKALGFSRKDIDYLTSEKRLSKVTGKGGVRGKYLKVEVAKLLGFRL